MAMVSILIICHVDKPAPLRALPRAILLDRLFSGPLTKTKLAILRAAARPGAYPLRQQNSSPFWGSTAAPFLWGLYLFLPPPAGGVAFRLTSQHEHSKQAP